MVAAMKVTGDQEPAPATASYSISNIPITRLAARPASRTRLVSMVGKPPYGLLTSKCPTVQLSETVMRDTIVASEVY